MCAVSSVMNTSNISICQKNFFSFPVAVNNSIKVDPLVFLLKVFVITEKIMKRPVEHEAQKIRSEGRYFRLLPATYVREIIFALPWLRL